MTVEVMKTKEYFLKVVSAVLQDKELPNASEQVNFSFLCSLAQKNTVEAIFYKAFSENSDLFSEEDFARIKKAYKLSVMRQMMQENELAQLRDIFNKNSIRFMLLKGAHLKALYPLPELRFMVDMDILLEPSALQFGKETLASRGFELDFDNGKDIVFIKKPFLTIELHRSLFQEEYFMYPFFTDCLEKAEAFSGSELKMNNNELYVYTLSHLAEHYTSAGSCFRPVMDLYLMEKNYADLDFSYISSRFEEIGILEFAENIRKLCRCMFEGEEKNETLELMENYIVLGPPVQNAGAASEMANSGQSKLGKILSTLFPSFRHMKLKYPILKKLPLLLPVLWLVRIIQYLFTKDAAIEKKKEQLKNSDKKSTDIMNEIFKKSGL